MFLTIVVFFYSVVSKIAKQNQVQKASAIESISAIQSRLYSSKGKDPSKKPGKAEELNVKMPGFVNPETMNEEGYFTQKAKEQLEELKKKGFKKPSLINPEKKE